MAGESHACPRCPDTLRWGEYETLEVAVCPTCSGVLLPQRDLTRVLEAVGKETAKDDRPDEPIEAIPDKGGGIACPVCGRVMEHHGYMERNEVKIDSCLSCGVVWLDTDELGVMSLIHARSKRRGRQHHERFVEAGRDAGKIVAAAALARSAERHLLSNWTYGRWG